MTRATILAALLAAASLARAQSPAFTYERDVVTDAPGWHHLALDPTVIAAGDPFRVSMDTAGSGVPIAIGGLGDLRLFDGDAHEVPYLLIAPPRRAQPRLAARPIAITPTKYASGFEVDLGAARPVDLIQIAGLPAPFLKRARLEGSGDRAHWALLVDQGTLFDLPQDRLKQLELGFPPGEYRYLRVTWDDRSSGRLPLPASVLVRSAASLAPAAMPLVVTVPMEPRASEPGRSRYVLRLPGTRLPVVAIRVVVADSNVLRSARVTEARLQGMDVAPVTLGQATLRRAVRGDAVASALEIPLTPPTEDRLDLVIEDGDNPPLRITRVEAVFAALPYVFFQTSAATTLHARYGARSLGAPRYDLEALRDSAGALPATMARWGEFIRLQPSAQTAETAGLPSTGAPIDVAEFKWSRAITDTAAGLATLRLDVPVLAHSRIGDLRIVDAEGHQVPYLLERLDGPLTDTLPALIRVARTDSTADPASISRYRFTLPFDSLAGTRVVLRTSARVFRRDVRIEAPLPETSRRAGMYVVARAQWAHADQETDAPALTLDLPPLGKNAAQLVIDEGDNTALPLEAPVLLLQAYQLRFLGTGGDGLRLVYGRRDATPPRYDIALLAPRLIGVPALEVTMAPEGSEHALPTNAIPGRIFWGALIAAVLVLLALVVKLVRAGAPMEAGEGAK